MARGYGTGRVSRSPATTPRSTSTRAPSTVQDHVVDEPGPARPSAATASTTSPSSSVARLERPRVAHLGVLERDERLAPPTSSRTSRFDALARRARPATAASPTARSASESTRAARALVGARGTRCGSTSRRRRARARAGSRARRPGGRGRAVICRTTASCWKSLRPKNAAHGPTIENSFATTVVTPSKCTGRLAPHSPSVSRSTCTVVSGAPVGVHLVDRSARRARRRLSARPRRGVARRGRAGTRRGPRSARTASGSRRA